VPPSSGRHATAKASALRQLFRLEDESALTDPEERLWDEDRDPNEQVDALDWYPEPGSPFAELDASDTVATRRRWWLAAAPAAGAEWSLSRRSRFQSARSR
jgi:hypothetical protein